MTKIGNDTHTRSLMWCAVCGSRAADHHYDRHGLYLQVLRSGTKQWVQRLVLDGERHDHGLGGYEQAPDEVPGRR